LPSCAPACAILFDGVDVDVTHLGGAILASADASTGVGIPIAIAAGLVSFLSPCVLPLVPGYLSTVIGVTPVDLKEGVGVRRVLVPSLLFIASFSSIFILLGLSATVLGSALKEHKDALTQIGGWLIIAMGVLFLASPFVRVLNGSWHSEALMRRARRGGPLIAGAAFAIAWTPCTSITLGAILTQAAISSSAAHGALLLAFYSLGLAIPFLAIALAFERMTETLAVVRRHFPVVIAFGGAVMIALGVLIVTGEFTTLNTWASQTVPWQESV
jgi:cytochrome c-type biogenesis protein